MEYTKTHNLSILTSIFIISLLSLVFLRSDYTANATTNETIMKIKIDKESFLNPNFLFLDIVLDSATSSFNSVMSVIDYDPSFIEVENIIFDNSFCSIIATTSIDNLAGQTTIICGNPATNASSTSQISRLKAKKINEGFTTIKLNNSQVLSADGLANNILTTTETHSIMIIKEGF